MWPFSRKVRKDAVDFCGEFYDRYVLGPDPIGAKCALAGAISTQQTICKFDESFSEVSLPKLTEELLALRLELIGTAWTHSSTEYAALAISEFTKQHLANIGRSELWEATLDYNHAVAESATFTAGRNTRSGCAMTAFIIQMRANLADDYFARGYDLEAAGRIVNRFGSGPRWNTGIAQALLAYTLTRRLDFEASDVIGKNLTYVCQGFYQGAKEALKGIKLTASKRPRNQPLSETTGREARFAA